MIDVPVLVMHGEDDQICPFPTTGAKSVMRGTLKSYPGLPHGRPTTHAEIINADLLAFAMSKSAAKGFEVSASFYWTWHFTERSRHACG